MTLPRTIVTLSAALVVMLAVVMLRAETTRLQYETSRFDREADVLLEQFREQQLELARLRNPIMIRDRAADLRLGLHPDTSRDGGGDSTAPRRNSPARGQSGAAGRTVSDRDSSQNSSNNRKPEAGKKPAKPPVKSTPSSSKPGKNQG